MDRVSCQQTGLVNKYKYGKGTKVHINVTQLSYKTKLVAVSPRMSVRKLC